MNKLKKIIFLLNIFLFFVFSCSSNIIYRSDIYKNRGIILSKNYNVECRKKVVNTARKYIGVRYKYGGSTSKGFDCSGFVYKVYLNACRIKLPRTAHEQAKYVKKTRSPKEGDLVFFKINSFWKIDHVGIYIGDGKFIHASSSKGVTISNLSSPYYKKHLMFFGTVFK